MKKDKRLIYINYFDGREVAVGRIKAGHILSVIQTDEILDMKINDVNVTGVYESIGNGTITVNGTEYEVAKDMYAPSVKLGSTVSIYLNAFNQVAYMDAITVTGGLQVGYLARLAENEGVFSSELRVRLLKESGELQILTIAEKMVLNDNYYTVKKDKDKILADLNYTAAKNIKPQLIQYALNTAGELCEIHLAADYLNADEDGLVMAIGQDTVDKGTGEVTKQGENLRYYTSYGITKGGTTIAKSDPKKTKIFMVPTWEKIGSAQQEDFVVMSHSDIVNESTYDMKLYYTSKKNALVDYIVIHHENLRGAKYTSSYNSNAGVFLNMVSVWDNGEAKPAVEYFNGKEAVTLQIADYAADSIPVMKKGDAMRVTLNWKGEVDSIEHLYNRATGETKTTTPNTSFAMGLGYIVFEKDDYVRVSNTQSVVNDSSVLSMYLFPKSATNVIVVEENDGNLSVTKGSADDIALGTNVFYIQRGTTMTYYIVYK